MGGHLTEASENRLIAEKLDRFRHRLSRQNRQGLYDLARYAEDLVCRLLNLVFGWELINLNDKQPNCPVIDLADRRRGICVQVTTVAGRCKAADTLKLLEKHHPMRWNRVLLFCLLGKPKRSSKPAPPLELWDLDDLRGIIEAGPESVRREVLAFLCSVEDKGLLEKATGPAEVDTYFVPKQEAIEDAFGGQTFYVHQLERVRLTAFIPWMEPMCCKLEFARSDTTGSHPTFGHEEIAGTLFSGHHGPLEGRGYAAAVSRERDFAALQLGSSRYFTDIDTAEQLGAVLDGFFEQCAATRDATAARLGTAGFAEPADANGRLPLARLPLWLWRAVRAFAARHDAWLAGGAWDLFDHGGPDTVVRIIRAPGEAEAGRRIVAELHAAPDGAGCTVSWVPGFAHDCLPWEGFDNQIKWRADHTHSWLMEALLPQVIEACYETMVSDGWQARLKKRLGLQPTVETFRAQVLRHCRSYRGTQAEGDESPGDAGPHGTAADARP